MTKWIAGYLREIDYGTDIYSPSMGCFLLKENGLPRLEEILVKARNDDFCNVLMAIPLYTSLLSSTIHVQTNANSVH